MVYTNDERFQVIHNENSEEWDLQIKFVQKRDNGTYECQVIMKPGMFDIAHDMLARIIKRTDLIIYDQYWKTLQFKEKKIYKLRRMSILVIV